MPTALTGLAPRQSARHGEESVSPWGRTVLVQRWSTVHVVIPLVSHRMLKVLHSEWFLIMFPRRSKSVQRSTTKWNNLFKKNINIYFIFFIRCIHVKKTCLLVIILRFEAALMIKFVTAVYLIFSIVNESQLPCSQVSNDLVHKPAGLGNGWVPPAPFCFSQTLWHTK